MLATDKFGFSNLGAIAAHADKNANTVINNNLRIMSYESVRENEPWAIDYDRSVQSNTCTFHNILCKDRLKANLGVL